MSIIGHQKLQNEIIKSINNNMLSHAHIIAGEKGIGKEKLVKYFACKIIGLDETRNHIDIGEWHLDKGKASIGVNTVRSIIEECNKKPFEGDKKVIIIYDGDKITFQAQNAFLKTIEEPPNNVFIFIVCEDLDQVLDTIKSRCCIHKLKPLTDEEMKEFLKRDYGEIGNDKLNVAVAFGKGIPGRVKNLLSNNDFDIVREKCFQLLEDITNGNKEISLAYEKFFTDYYLMIDDILDIIITIIRDVILYKEIGSEELLINIDRLSSIKDLSNVFSLAKLSDMIKIIEDTRNTLKSNVNSSLAFITMVLRMQEV